MASFFFLVPEARVFIKLKKGSINEIDEYFLERPDVQFDEEQARARCIWAPEVSQSVGLGASGGRMKR